MHALDLVTILCVGLLVGNELAISLFVNPALWQLEDHAQANALSLLARSLGKVMPFWYALSLTLLLAEAYGHRHGAALNLLLTAVSIWAAIVIYTILILVPINKRTSSLVPTSLPIGWRQDHKKWDKHHRLRILLLIAAMSCLIFALTST